MAAYSHYRNGSRASLFNGDGNGDQELPAGSCNFRDISLGANASNCGCQRFYLNPGQHNGQDERAFCFCGHHACFHRAFSQHQTNQEQASSAVQATGGEEHGNMSKYTSENHHATSASPKPPTGLGIRSGSRSQSDSINTRVWQALNDFARNQEEGGVIGGASRLPSTAAPSVVEEPRLSPNHIIQERLRQYRSMGPPLNIPPGVVGRVADEYSATEVATPSIAGTPDFRATVSSPSQNRSSPGHLPPGLVEPAHQPGQLPNPCPPANVTERPSTAPPQAAIPIANPPLSGQDIQSIIRSYGHRLEVLESLSFSQVPVEELQERFELYDGRILDLEQWRNDSDQARISPEPTKPSSSKRRRLLPSEGGSFTSDASFDLNAAAHTEAAVLATLAANAETHPRIDALESRVSDLENAALPSFTNPWHVQVILLPWGRDLRGIWFSSAEATQQSIRSTTQVSDEWTGAQSAQKLSFNSSISGAWTTESIQAWANEAHEWLSPKACGPGGAVFQRLASRGFVREITLTASDARHVMSNICSAFGKALKVHSDIDKEQATRYQGFNELFVPLRKIRKSARLRFLSPAEMITSASWTAGFFDSSVFMKVTDGQRRLYVTTPDSYIQPSECRWSWQSIRELPIPDSSPEEQNIQAGHLAIEACWTYNSKLDQPISNHSSFASHESQWSSRSQLAEGDANEIAQQLFSPRSEGQLPRQRTVSLPGSSSAVEQIQAVVPKRRVASFEPVATVPIRADDSGDEFVAKRRRISQSSEAERRGVNFTPRWSREPPSPYTSEVAAEARSQGTSSRKRGTTPFAYATPHSNSNYVSRMDLTGADGDTEVDTEIMAGQSDRGEEEWQGVEDGNTNLDEEEEGSNIDEADVPEDHLGEGMAGYEH